MSVSKYQSSIPRISQEPVKSLGRWYDSSLKDTKRGSEALDACCRPLKTKPYKASELSHDSIVDFDYLNKEYHMQDAFDGIFESAPAKSDGNITVRFAQEIRGKWEVRPYRKRGAAIGCFRKIVIPTLFSKPCEFEKDKEADEI
ncbi:hypothetical protein PoB_001994600 [Plakobranchus ocellatus]|uniref:Uncharacterized protein n=1 Tax=Plakobranchus ocellatus TaxID=259542 RepID=A0AAV3Z2B4_9GAST|nr:hypothetical protein PoB_001994600 [Plakobranchus ocellatus]